MSNGTIDLRGNTNFVVLKNLLHQEVVPRTNLAAVDLTVANGLAVAGNTMYANLATADDIVYGTSGHLVDASVLNTVLNERQDSLEAGTGIEIVSGETASTISVLITDAETLIDGTTATKVVDVAALRGALTTGQAVDVTSVPDQTITGDYKGTFTTTDTTLGFASFPKYVTGFQYLMIADVTVTDARDITPSGTWLDGSTASKGLAANTATRVAMLFDAADKGEFTFSGNGTVTVSNLREYEVTACTDEAIAYIASLSNPDAFADYYLMKADMVQPWTPIIDMGSSPAVTIESNHSYKLLATGTHQLSVGTCPVGYTGQDALITIIVGAAGTVQTVAPLKTSATFTSASINDCVVKFRDGKAFLLVENTEEAYVVSVTSGTEEGSLPYGLVNNASVIMFAPATSGQSIALSGVTATISDGVSIFGNGTDSTLLDGGELTCSGELSAFELTFNESVIKGGVLTCTNVLLSQGVWVYSCVINNASVSGGLTELNDGSVANNCTLDDGELDVSSGCVANNTILTGGAFVIDTSGTADNTTISGGYLYASGGTANYTTLRGGSFEVSSGGLASNTTIPGAYLHISSGGTANSTTVNDWGEMYVSKGGMASDTTVNSSGHLYVYSGGTANSTTVNTKGYLHVSSGGTATDILENGGFVGVADGANATFVPNSIFGLLIAGASATVHSGTTANSTTVNTRGYLYISSGGTANSTTVNSSGYFYVTSSGTANSTTVNGSRGRMYISSGGVATEPIISSGGSLTVSSGGTALLVTSETGAVITSNTGAYITYKEQ